MSEELIVRAAYIVVIIILTIAGTAMFKAGKERDKD